MRKTADVVIIGGGIIGCATAYFLSRQIKNVVLLERKGIASEASGANYGMVWSSLFQPGYGLAMTKRSQELYPKLVSEAFDLDIEYEKKGGLLVFFTELERKAAEIVVHSKQNVGIPVQLLDSTEVRKLEPALSEEVVGAIYGPEDVQINGILTTLAFARAARKEGAAIYTGTEVRSIKLHNRSVESVVTNRGEIKTKVVINATGSWASQIGEMVGLKIPIHPYRLEAMVTEQIPHLLSRVIQGTQGVAVENPSLEEAMSVFYYAALDASAGELSLDQKPVPAGTLAENSQMYLKPTMDGNIVCGECFGFEGYNRSVSYERLGLVAAMARKVVPKLKDVHIIRSWCNFEPYVKDGIPIVGETEVEGFIMAAGHEYGMHHGPATGETLAALIVDGKPLPFAEQLSIARFTS